MKTPHEFLLPDPKGFEADPGSGRVDDLSEVFSLSEGHMISAHDLFSLAGRVMGHTREVVEQ